MFGASGSPHATTDPAWLDAYREPAARLIGEAIGSTFAWQRLAVLTDSIGNRVSGSEALNRAIRWAVDEMKRDGLENVHTEKVMCRSGSAATKARKFSSRRLTRW
jgi:hypothetical protein